MSASSCLVTNLWLAGVLLARVPLTKPFVASFAAEQLCERAACLAEGKDAHTEVACRAWAA